MDFTLTEEQKILQKKAREFAINEVLPVARKYDDSEEFPLPVIKKAWEQGLYSKISWMGKDTYRLLAISCTIAIFFSARCENEDKKGSFLGLEKK